LRIVLLAGSAILASAPGWSNSRGIRADDEVAAPVSRAAPDGILVMRNGMVVSGKILKTGNDYEVQSPQGGKAFYVGGFVKLHAPTLSDAYDKLRESAKAQKTANAHIFLAQWCLANHLDSEARQELQDALTLEPDREDARRLLRNAEETIESRGKPAPVAVHEDPVRAARLAAASTDDAVSLGGLSREQALRFARRIQPLLVNNCTAAGCHGRDSQTGFRLQKVTPGKDANRHAAERNLAEVLEQIDTRKPRSSPLLTAPRGNHGRRGRPVFAGQRGEEQLAELQKWVAAVAREEPIRAKPGERDIPQKDRVEQVSAGSAPPPKNSSPRSGALPAAKEFPAGPSDGKASTQIPLPAGRGDPFDPAAFNRASDRRSGR
jgi:hypothetical protein